MNKRTILWTVIFSLCMSLTVPIYAERVKPELPAPATLELNTYYYLWNEDAGTFWGSSNTFYPLANAFRVLMHNNNYVIEKSSGSYLHRNGTTLNTCSSIGGYYGGDTYFAITAKDNNLYTIQSLYDYSTNDYVGVKANSTTLTPVAGVNDYIKWRLIPVDSLSAAQMMLYLALEQLPEGVPTEYYDQILANATSSDELIYATREMLSFKAVKKFDNSDYSLAFIDDPNEAWYEYSGGFAMGDPTYYWNTSANKKVLTAIVEIDEDEVMMRYNAGSHTSNRYYWEGIDKFSLYYNNEDIENSLNVYIDNVLVRSIPADCRHTHSDAFPWDTDSYYYEKLSKGVHIIKWEYLNNSYSGNTEYNYGYITDITIMKSHNDVISVSLKEPGSLGTEVLAVVNSLRNVKSLKVRGEMNQDDWASIGLMDSLRVLDLSQAIVNEVPDYQFQNHVWLCQIVLPKGLARIGNRAFDNAERLHDIKLPEGLTHIGNYAFNDTHISEMMLPSTLQSVGEYAFFKSDLEKFDASHSQLREIRNYAFQACLCLRSVTLPTDSMYSIGAYAFHGNYLLEDVSMPKVVENIGDRAFYDCHRMKKLRLPERVGSMGISTFCYLKSLESDIIFPKGLATIPDYTFYKPTNNTGVKKIYIPDDVTTVGQMAFDGYLSLDSLRLSNNLQVTNYCSFASCGAPSITLPASLTTIGQAAFGWTSRLDSIVVPEGASIDTEAFRDAKSLKYIELPTTYYNIDKENVFLNCNSIEHIKIKSPTKLFGYTGTFIPSGRINHTTIEVPDFLVSAYKLDTYWYNYKDVVGFATSDVDKWTIQSPVVLGAGSRLQGSPSIDIIRDASLTVLGESSMSVNNFRMNISNSINTSNKWYNYNTYGSQVISSVNIEVEGKMELSYASYGNNWVFISLPFDIKVSDIQVDAQYAIRYYDGASRADSARSTDNWKDYAPDDTIPAGTGFIYQHNYNGWASTTFTACNTASKSQALNAKEIAIPLQKNNSVDEAHSGWNLVGNPWMTYYNIHSIGFTGPITVYNTKSNPPKYEAYSIIDDDVALYPTQAFFVQCPADVESITFPTMGRQLTAEVKNQNGVETKSTVARCLVDIALCDTSILDKTRIVFNDKARNEYDRSMDAAKFFVDDQKNYLYTVDEDGEAYAINERPFDESYIDVVFSVAEAGEYSISMTRSYADEVILKDLLLGIDTNLNDGDYLFNTQTGMINDRFKLVIRSNATTNIKNKITFPEVKIYDNGIYVSEWVEVYTSDGRLITQNKGFISLDKGVYMLRKGQSVYKTVVK